MPPARFLPVLESSGMIVAVGDWVLRKAAEDCRRWQRRGLCAGARRGERLRAADPATHVRRERAEGGRRLRPATATASTSRSRRPACSRIIEGTSRKLRELRTAGVRIAIDDFGTGYSSLGLLSKLPVDLLKIDRAFISGLPADRASVTLVSSIIGLASAFDLTSIAEGVETRGAARCCLRELQCHQSQGYFHSRPVPVEQIEALLARQRHAAALPTTVRVRALNSLARISRRTLSSFA